MPSERDNKFIDNACKDELYKHPKWRETAANFELTLGKGLVDSPYVKAAARDAYTPPGRNKSFPLSAQICYNLPIMEKTGALPSAFPLRNGRSRLITLEE